MKTLRMKNWLLALAATTVAAMVFVAPAAHAATSDPDDLVNTEAFTTIAPGAVGDDIGLQFGTDAADRLLQFNIINDRFEFGNDLYVNGGLEVQGDIDQDGNIFTLDADSTVDANVSIVAHQSVDADGILRYNAGTNEWEISNDGGTYYSVATANDIATLTGVDSNTFTLDQDDTTGDVSLVFGTLLAESLTWDEANTRFVLSHDLFIDGGLTLNGDLDFDQNQAVDLVLHQGATLPSIATSVEGQTFYKTDTDTMYIFDGANWIALAASTGSGHSIFLSPQYPHTTYHNDLSDNVGRLSYDFDATNVENYYRWATTKTGIQDYDIKVRIQLPQDFANWDATPINLLYRTNVADVLENAIDFQMHDSSSVLSASSTGLNSANAWATVTPAVTAGTFSAGDWVTVTIKTYSTKDDFADVGSLVLNYIQ
jgi:hypothetical protein